ncbi:MAG: chorismate synthase [Saccharofermentans sp.]|nr:chorismate synthase [Saccharofermentans sp.]
MESIYEGQVLKIRIYGESHSERIGAYIEGLPEGVSPDMDITTKLMARRAPGRNAWSTPRKEPDTPNFEKEGSALHAYIVNTNTKPKDYASIMNRPRPSHADFTAPMIYGDDAAVSGGGIFSGRMTAPLCMAGSIALSELSKRGINIAAHIKSIGDVEDDCYMNHGVNDTAYEDALTEVKTKEFPCVDDSKAEEMKAVIAKAREELDSIGGVIECVIYGMPCGIGGPLFGGIEGKISQVIFAVPAVKGIEFGNGFEGSRLLGSANNDAFMVDSEGKIRLKTNHSGGILGGISVGEAAPIVFSCAMKPTPSIGKEQETVDIKSKTNTTISIQGRHDPCIVPRAVPVIEAAAAIAIYDMILSKEANKNG